MIRRIAKSPPQRLRQAGLTLIELLVSLVILGFVVTVMSGAFYQVAQVVRVAEGVNGHFQPQWVRMRALSDLVGNLAMPEGVARPFSGDVNGFSGFSLSMPQADWGLVQEFSIKLTRQEQGSGTNLILTPTDGKETVLTSWDHPVQLEYLATDGSTHFIWPPFGKARDALPSGIIVRATAGDQLAQIIAPYTGGRVPPRDGKDDMAKLFGVEIK